MPESLSLFMSDGRSRLEIPDWRGEVFPYDWSVEFRDDARVYRLEKVGSVEPAVYHVVHRPGSWVCDCPDFIFRMKRKRLLTCKHCDVCRLLEPLILAIPTQVVDLRKAS